MVYRDPHDVCEVAVFLDGHPIEVVRMHEVSPAAYSPREWLEMGAEAANAPGRSQAWAQQVSAWYASTVPLLDYDEHDDSEDRDRSDGNSSTNNNEEERTS